MFYYSDIHSVIQHSIKDLSTQCMPDPVLGLASALQELRVWRGMGVKEESVILKSGAGFEAGTVCGGTGTAGQGDAHMRERNKWYLVTQGLSVWRGGADVKP